MNTKGCSHFTAEETEFRGCEAPGRCSCSRYLWEPIALPALRVVPPRALCSRSLLRSPRAVGQEGQVADVLRGSNAKLSSTRFFSTIQRDWGQSCIVMFMVHVTKKAIYLEKYPDTTKLKFYMARTTLLHFMFSPEQVEP